MFRPLTIICVILFLLAGFFDYQTTHSVDLIDQKIAAARDAALAARNDTKVLQTEWSWLNRPDRLQPFAAKFLSLQGVTPAQYVPFDQLAQHLPPPGAPPAPAAPPPPAPVFTPPATVLAAANPAPVQPVQPVQPIAAPPKSAVALNTPAASPAPAPPPKPVLLAAAHPAPKPKAPPRPQYAVQSPAPRRTPPVMVAANEPPRPQVATRSYSSLGMAQSGTAPPPPPVAVTDAAWHNN